MSRLAVSLVGILALAGCAGTPTRSLHVDARDQAAFEASVASFKQELSSHHWVLFTIALGDIWQTTAAEAGPTSSEADTSRAYFARLNGLTYEDIIGLADATPPTTQERYWASRARAPKSFVAVSSGGSGAGSGPPGGYGTSYNANFPMAPSGHIQGY